MLIENDGEILLECSLHQLVQRGEPLLRKLVVLVHVLEGLQHDPHRIESALADDFHMARLKSCLGGILPQGIVADDVHATADLADRVGCRGQVCAIREGG